MVVRPLVRVDGERDDGRRAGSSSLQPVGRVPDVQGRRDHFRVRTVVVAGQGDRRRVVASYADRLRDRQQGSPVAGEPGAAAAVAYCQRRVGQNRIGGAVVVQVDGVDRRAVDDPVRLRRRIVGAVRVAKAGDLEPV